MRVKRKVISYAIICVLSLLGTFPIFGQLYINEFLASNSTIIADPEFNEHSDWIEIYNGGTSTVNLNGYYLTDNLDNPVKWQFSSDITIEPESYLLIWADGQNTGLHTSFKLSALGEEIGLFNPDLDIIDTLNYIYQTTDISYGRTSAASASWAYYTEPTPGSPNNTTPYFDRAEQFVNFSMRGGIYSEGFGLKLDAYPGGVIRYTTDGSEPTGFSTIYDSPIAISSTTIIRARVITPSMIPGPVTTHTYFIDENLINHELPIISIATDPDNFWDQDVGIYVQDFKPEWEVPINIELFENDGSDRAAFNELAGTKVNGLWSWQLPQKMLGVYFRNQYGSNRLNYPIIHTKARNSYKSFALRASGSDWSYTFMRDGMVHTASRYNTDIDIQDIRPCIVYVNGEYLGLHNIREKVDENYVVANHNLPEGSFDMVENTNFAEAGDLAAMNELLQLLEPTLSEQSNFDAVASLIDIENFTDYICTELYSGNYSINHNVMAWKPKDSGLWKWVLMDLDRGFFNPDAHLIDFYADNDVFPFGDLMENDSYKLYFGKRLADHLYTTYNPIRIHKLIDKFQNNIEAAMPNQIARWQGTTSSYGDALPSIDYWHGQVNNLKIFASERIPYLLDDLKDYGFSSPYLLELNVSPPTGGAIEINNLKIPEFPWSGSYPSDLEFVLTAIDRPGYDFIGWSGEEDKIIIAANSSWKYLDDGSNQGTSWKNAGFDDTSWATGTTKMGYGEDDLSTVINFGPDQNNKYHTTYFRKAFSLTADDLQSPGFVINLLCDDGAVIYINGQEVNRFNMAGGTVDYLQFASECISGAEESSYERIAIDRSFFLEGSNIVAVEIHQCSASSSDVSFDLYLSCTPADASKIISTNQDYSISLSDNRKITALFEPNGSCIIPEVIDQDMSLSRECSPYVAQGDITITKDAVLTIEAGVEIYLAKDANIYVYGQIDAAGNPDERIKFELNPEYNGDKWGAICFVDTDLPSQLSYVNISSASQGPDPIRFRAAISAYQADLVLDHLIIDDVYSNPIAARYADISLTNSRLHSKVTGDLVNVKYGRAYIENCELLGNNEPDTDGIDYDEITDGVIRNCTIYNFFGFNSDGIDIGEEAENITIENTSIYNITDKGISVGQKSTATINNCIFVNCNLGLGLKDSCMAYVNKCTFYGVTTPVSCYEKNPGKLGGNAIVQNSILSNSYERTYFSDSRSSILLNYSLSDNDPLPAATSNYFGDPFFEGPSQFNFQFAPNSPCILSGFYNGETIDLGSDMESFSAAPSLMFSKIFYNPLNFDDQSEFLSILNPGDEPVDLFGYYVDLGIEYAFTEHILLQPNQEVYLVKNMYQPSINSYYGHVREWSTGRLANEGEALRLYNAAGIIIDQVIYEPDNPWPVSSGQNSEVLSLMNPGADNHFGYNWELISYYSMVGIDHPVGITADLKIYPNPTSGQLTIMNPNELNQKLQVYTLTGTLVLSGAILGSGSTEIDLSALESGIYLIKVDEFAQKIILRK